MIKTLIFSFAVFLLAAGFRGNSSNVMVTNMDTLPKKSKDTSEAPIIFQKVTIDARIETIVWTKYLQQNIPAHIQRAAAKNPPPGEYKVTVIFMVDRDGTLKEIKAQNDPGYGFAKSAEELVKNAPEWLPAIENGRNISSYRRETIVFEIKPDK